MKITYFWIIIFIISFVVATGAFADQCNDIRNEINQVNDDIATTEYNINQQHIVIEQVRTLTHIYQIQGKLDRTITNQLTTQYNSARYVIQMNETIYIKLVDYRRNLRQEYTAICK